MKVINYRRRNLAARTSAWTMLVTFTTATAVLNIWAANIGSQNPWLHGIVPVIVLATALFAELVALSSVDRVTKTVVVAISIPVFGTVLGLSYVGVLRVLEDQFRPVAGSAEAILVYGGAAVPDALMVAASLALVGLRIRSARNEVTDSSVFGGIGAEVSGLATSWLRKKREKVEAQPVMSAPSVPERFGNPLTNAAEPSAVTAPTAAVNNGAELPEAFGNRFPSPSENFSNQVLGTFENSASGLLEQVPEPAAEVPEPAPVPVPEQVRKPKPKTAAPSVDSELESYLPGARWMLEGKRVTRKKPEEVAAVVRLAVEDGLTPSQIRKRLGGGVETIENILRAWREWERIKEKNEPEPELDAELTSEPEPLSAAS